MMKTTILSAVVAAGFVAPASFVFAQQSDDAPATGQRITSPQVQTQEDATTRDQITTTVQDGTMVEDAEAEPTVDAGVDTSTSPAVDADAAAENSPDPAQAVDASDDTDAEAASDEALPSAEGADSAREDVGVNEDVVQDEAAEAAEEVAEDQPDAVEDSQTEVIAEDDVSGQAHGDDPEVGVMDPEDHGTGADDHAATDEEDHGDDSHATPHIENIDFSFDGPFGAYDVNQLQRGLQIYTEVCAACHGLEYVAIRTLGDDTGPGLPEEQVIEYAKQFDVYDSELDDTRPATPVDHFPQSNLANAPDLSLMAKKRAAFHGPYGLGINQFLKGIGGPEYITALLTGYTGEEKEQAGTVLYGNTVFPGGWIAMAPPLGDGQVDFVDEHANDLHNLSEDVSAFLMWTAEPKLGARKQAGFAGVVFLTLLSVLLYLTNKRLWARHKHKES